MNTIQATLDREDGELEVTIEYSYYGGCRGARDSVGGVMGAGPPLEPDEPASIEIESLKDMAGNEIEIGQDGLDVIEAKIWEVISEPDYGD